MPEDEVEVKDEVEEDEVADAVMQIHEGAEPGFVRDDSIMQRILPNLRWERFLRRGNRLNPEPPRLVAKVCREPGKGELWLGPLPTEPRIGIIMQVDHSIQVYCFQKTPTKAYVKKGGDYGMFIPDTLAFRCEMSMNLAQESIMTGLCSFYFR